MRYIKNISCKYFIHQVLAVFHNYIILCELQCTIPLEVTIPFFDGTRRAIDSVGLRLLVMQFNKMVKIAVIGNRLKVQYNIWSYSRSRRSNPYNYITMTHLTRNIVINQIYLCFIGIVLERAQALYQGPYHLPVITVFRFIKGLLITLGTQLTRSVVLRHRKKCQGNVLPR